MLVTVGSVTTATRLARIIGRSAGIPSELVHTPVSISNGGCSYSVRVKDKYNEIVRNIIKEYNVPVKHFYTETVIDGKRVYNGVS